MRIAIVTKTFPPFSSGGTETYAEQFATELSKQEDVEVHVICFQSSPIPVPDDEVARYRESHPFTMHIAGVHYKESRLLRDIRNIRAVRGEMMTILTGIRPDIIQTVGVYSETISALSIGRKLGIPTIIFPRGSDVNRPLGPLRSRIRSSAFRRASLVMCQTRWVRGRLVNGGFIRRSSIEERTLIVPNAIHLPVSSRKMGDQGPEHHHPSYPTILWIGRFEWMKFPDVAINVFRDFRATFPQGTHLVMIGDGSEWEAMRTLAGDDSTIILTGQLPQSGIGDHLDQATLLWNTSDSEGFPQTFLEAMAHGVPIVCFDATANSEIVENGVNGYVVDGEEAQELYDALNGILTDGEVQERMRQANLERVREFSWEVILPRILKAYKGLIRKNRRSDNSLPQ